MMNNTLLEAVLISRALCHSGCPRAESEKVIAGADPIPASTLPWGAVPYGGLNISLGGFSVEISAGTVRHNGDGVRPGTVIGMG